MPVLSTRIDDNLYEQLERVAKKHGESVAAALRRLVKDGLAVAAYKEQNAETTGNELSQERRKLELEYKRNFEFVVLELSALAHLIVKESGKFSNEEATKLLSKAQNQVETYMRRFESGVKK